MKLSLISLTLMSRFPFQLLPPKHYNHYVHVQKATHKMLVKCETGYKLHPHLKSSFSSNFLFSKKLKYKNLRVKLLYEKNCFCVFSLCPYFIWPNWIFSVLWNSSIYIIRLSLHGIEIRKWNLKRTQEVF